jgi:hypothetical protein
MFNGNKISGGEYIKVGVGIYKGEVGGSLLKDQRKDSLLKPGETYT